MKCHGDKKSGPKIHTLDFLRHIQMLHLLNLVRRKGQSSGIKRTETLWLGFLQNRSQLVLFFFQMRYHLLFPKICLA